MKRYSYTVEKVKREIEAYLAGLDLPTLSILEETDSQAKGWEGEGTVDSCKIMGKLTVGKGSKVISCTIGPDADVVIGDNCLVCRCSFSDKTEIGNDCQLVASSFVLTAKIGSGSKVLLAEVLVPLTTGPRFGTDKQAARLPV